MRGSTLFWLLLGGLALYLYEQSQSSTGPATTYSPTSTGPGATSYVPGASTGYGLVPTVPPISVGSTGYSLTP